VSNGATLALAGSGVNNLALASGFTVNGGTLLLDNNSSALTSNRMGDTATLTLNNTAFQANGQFSNFGNQIEGFRIQSNMAGLRSETIGAITLGAGANTISGQATTSDAIVQLTADSVTRQNASTLLLRGTNLGTTAVVIGFDFLLTGALPTMVGGGSTTLGTTNISIIPWITGDTSTNLTAGNLGFVTYSTINGSSGFRVLNTANEYENLVAGGGTTVANNVRYSSNASLTMTGSSHTMNALWLDNTHTTTAITVAGSGTDALNVQSGDFLFSGTGGGITLSGFNNGITTGTNSEYIFHVENTTTAGVTISSSLTTANSIVTKTGPGALTLSGTANTVGTYNLNQGVLIANALTNLKSSGAPTVNFYGGTFRFGTAFDLSAATLNFNAGGGTIDTNGKTVVFANSIGNGTSGPLTKTGGASLQINSSINITGVTNVINGILILNNTTTPNTAIGAGGLFIGGPLAVAATGTDNAVQLNADEQIADNANVTIECITGSMSTRLNLNNHKETIGSLTITGGTQTAFTTGVVTGTGTLVLNGDLNFVGTRVATGNTGREALITSSGLATTSNYTGTGKLDLGGVLRNITVSSPNIPLNIAGSDATIETVVTNGGINKYGGRTLYLANTNGNTYALTTNIYDGVLAIGSAGALGTGDGTAATGTTVYDGGTLQLGFAQGAVGSQSSFTVSNEALVINGQGGGSNAGALRNTLGTNVWNTQVTMGSDARISADAGTLTLNNGITSGGSNYNLSVGGLAGATVNVQGTIALSGGGITKDGGSNFIVTNAANYTGATNVKGGTLTVAVGGSINGSTTVNVTNTGTLAVLGSVTGSNILNVNTGGILTGSGSVTTANNGNVVVGLGGKLQPTAASTLSLTLGAGSLDLTAAVTPTNSQSLIFAINATGNSAEVAVTTGTLNIGTGVLEFDDFQFTLTGTFATAATIPLFHTDGTNSTIAAGNSLGTNVNGLINGIPATLAIQGNDVVLQVVPEPNALTMLAGSFGMALGLQRFRRRRTA
jgi:autotransporter-associated beta strand protein